MIEVGDAREPHMTAVLELTQNVDQGYRVGSARERDHDTPARLDERIAPDGAQDGSGECHQRCPATGSVRRGRCVRSVW